MIFLSYCIAELQISKQKWEIKLLSPKVLKKNTEKLLKKIG